MAAFWRLWRPASGSSSLNVSPSPGDFGSASIGLGLPGQKPQLAVGVWPDADQRCRRITSGSDRPLAPCVDHHRSVARDLRGACPESGQHRLEIGVEIGVVELDRADEEDVGSVVEKLRSAVEEGGVVLVSFDDKEGTATEAEPSGVPARKSADEIAGVGSRLLENPGQHCRGRGLAVGACNNHAFKTACKNVVCNRLRLRQVGDSDRASTAADLRVVSGPRCR